MLLLGWLAGCGEKVSVNGTEGDRHQENDSISRRVTGAVGPDAELAVWSSGIWTMNADGSNRTQVYDSSASDPAWSPDGEKVAFSKSTPNGLSFIYIMNADGCGKRRLTPPDSDNEHPEQGPAWSPGSLQCVR
jgi:dipeptidyl aminopeptidase/acylaminoacyl peptidase